MPTPEEMNEATREFLRDYPDAEGSLRELLERDRSGPWTFDDVAMDSGRFGELISRDIAEQTDDGYRLRHPDAVEAALDGETLGTADEGRTDGLRSRLREAVSVRELTALIGALAIVVAARVHSYRSVFREGHVVSPGNDPYFYRYWQEQLLARSSGVTDFGLLADMGGAAGSRPLTHAVNWWLAELLGGSADAAATVAAWLPVLGAVALGILLYLLAKLLTGDFRVALAAVAFLGLAPVHVVYTSVGFLEHRLHQYFWLGVLALGLAWLAVDVQRRRTDTTDSTETARQHAFAPESWAVAAVVAVAVAASAHTWGGSPLTFIPVALYVALRGVIDVEAGVPPVFANLPLLGGLAGGGVLTLGLHFGLGWHEPLAAGTPLLVAVGGFGVLGLAEGWQRLGRSARSLLGAEALITVLGVVAVWVLQPVNPDRILRRLDDLLFREEATETASLFTAEYAYLLGPLWQIGISFYFGLAALAVGTLVVARRYEPGWLVCVCFAWYYMLLAALQARFAAQLVFFIALFAGVACVYLLAKVDLVRQFTPFDRSDPIDISDVSMPGGTRSGYLVGTVCLLLIFNFIFIPTLVGQVLYTDEQFEAALEIDDHVENVDREYPDTAIETRWDEIRMYNYFVNGESGSYDSRYTSFLTAEDPDEQHTNLRQNGKYIVINRWPESPGPAYDTLYEGLGVGYGDVNQTAGRYQPVYLSDEERVFTVVEGAVLNVSGDDGRELTATTDVEIDGETIEYERRGTVAEGFVEIRVAHAGEYTIAGETVTVSEENVSEGEELRIDGGS